LRWHRLPIRWIRLLAGVGFTVSLLIGDLAYGVGSDRDQLVKIGVLAGSLIAAALAAIVLRLRNRHYRALCGLEEIDQDHDGIPDVYAKREPRQ
jgi:Na+:H+ antiporter, NhaA family